MKTFGASNDAIKKVKRQPPEEEKIFANQISHKGLASMNINITLTTQ